MERAMQRGSPSSYLRLFGGVPLGLMLGCLFDAGSVAGLGLLRSGDTPVSLAAGEAQHSLGFPFPLVFTNAVTGVELGELPNVTEENTISQVRGRFLDEIADDTETRGVLFTTGGVSCKDWQTLRELGISETSGQMLSVVFTDRLVPSRRWRDVAANETDELTFDWFLNHLQKLLPSPDNLTGLNERKDYIRFQFQPGHLPTVPDFVNFYLVPMLERYLAPKFMDLEISVTMQVDGNIDHVRRNIDQAFIADIELRTGGATYVLERVSIDRNNEPWDAITFTCCGERR